VHLDQLVAQRQSLIRIFLRDIGCGHHHTAGDACDSLTCSGTPAFGLLDQIVENFLRIFVESEPLANLKYSLRRLQMLFTILLGFILLCASHVIYRAL
jgi:hypothetical protein